MPKCVKKAKIGLMSASVRKSLLVLWMGLAAAVLLAGPNEPGGELPTVRAYLISCKGLIDEGLAKSIERRTQTAVDEGADYLIYEIETYGGLLEAGDEIAKQLLSAGKKAHTVAFITTEAISAGAMISVSCEDIIMRENATIGDCAPIQLGAKLEGVEREKAESFVRAAFDRAAEANHYPEALLRAMVTMQIEVYRVKNNESGEHEFFEGAYLPTDANKYDLDDKELIVAGDRLLTLTASKAVEYGVARAEVEDLQGAVDFLAERDGVTFLGGPVELKPNWSEQMVRWLNSPPVMGILIMVALLGVYIEMNTPGVGLPGLVAVICFVVIIGSKYLVGLANWVEVALFVVGVLLLLIEIFVIPGFGIVGVLGILCILAGLFGMLIRNPPDKLPWPRSTPDWQIFTNGALGLAIGFIGFIVLAAALSKYLPRLAFLSGLMLAPAVAKRGDEFEVSTTSVPREAAVRVKVGDTGEVVSTLRPAGRAKFGPCVVDCVAEGEFIQKGKKVEIIEIRGNRVVVRAVGE